MKTSEPWRVLSVRPAWAWLVMSQLPERKDFENREWGPDYGPRRYIERTGRQRIWIHASKGGTSADDDESFALAVQAGFPRGALPHPADLTLGAILGSVEIAEWGELASPWSFGGWGLRVMDPRPLRRPVPARGQVGLWKPPPALAAELARQAA